MDAKQTPRFLISISIGPVQEFIASARRSRDLWFGSWLLSELSKAAAKSIQDQNGDLVFPTASGQDLAAGSSFSVVNKILAEVTGDPATIGGHVKRAVDDRLEEISRIAFTRFERAPKKFIDIDKANLQIADIVEFFWTAIDFPDPSQYRSVRSKGERLFSARKATRDFRQVNLHATGKPNDWGDNVPKSSLDGQRESVIKEELFRHLENGGISKDELRLDYGIKEGERLCGVGLLKRHGRIKEKGESLDDDYQDRFFSTSHVASLPLLERIQKHNQLEPTKAYLEDISGFLHAKDARDLYRKVGRVPMNLKHEVFGEYDGHLLFAERLSEFLDDNEKLALARSALRSFLDQVLGKNKQILPYYALVLADGDFMGKAIDNQETKTEHQRLSAALSRFAGDVRNTIESRGQGSVIYAGGDDVLAFVGLHRMLEYTNTLQRSFKDNLNDFRYEGESSPTLSVGVAVVHHLEPLEDALALARRAEAAAKAVKGKNALAIIVDKRSGAPRIAKGMWGTVDKRMKSFVRWHRENSIPDGAAYQLRDLAYRLEVPEGASEEFRKVLNETKAKEAKRILKRKKKDFGESAVDEETVEKLEQFIRDIDAAMKEGEDSIAILADELIIAKEIAAAEDTADMEIRK